MAIQTVGGFNKLIDNFETGKWTKTAQFDDKFKIDSNELLANPGEIATTRDSFSQLLSNSIAKVNSMQQEANISIQKLVTGESKNIHETMLAVEKAEIAFKTMNQIRSKVIDAYKEIMRMQV